MGCQGSVPKPEYPKDSPIKKKSSIRKGAQANMQAQASAAMQNATQQAQEGYDKANTYAKKATEKAKDYQNAITREYAKIPIDNIVKDFQGRADDSIVGPKPKDVVLFEVDHYSTEEWSNLLFAIYNKNINVVRYFIEYKQMNPRTNTKRRTHFVDDTEYDLEVFPLMIALSNKDEDMLDYLWGLTELWGFSHFQIVLHASFARINFMKGVDILLGSEATQDCYNSLTYEDKTNFMIELYYRYLAQTNDKIKSYIREVSVQRPYSLMVVHFLMSEMKEHNNELIEKATDSLMMEDYAKMKFEANEEFLANWDKVLEEYKKQGGNMERTYKYVKR